MSEQIKFLFLLGRPGSGKSYIYKNIITTVLKTKGAFEIERIDDFPILEKLLNEDRGFERHVREDGGFRVTDWTIIDDVLKEMDEKLKSKEDEDRVTIAEFSRDNYRKALRNFSQEVRSKSLLMYIWAPFETCLKDNKRRFAESAEDAYSVDDHIVPDKLMDTYYRNDDLEKLYLDDPDDVPFGFFGWNIRFFDNSDRDMELERKKEKFAYLIKEFEF